MNTTFPNRWVHPKSFDESGKAEEGQGVKIGLAKQSGAQSEHGLGADLPPISRQVP